MQSIIQAVQASFSTSIKRIILSNPKEKSAEYKKIIIRKLYDGYQIEKYTEKQVFHENTEETSVPNYIINQMTDSFRQYNAWDESHEYMIRINKKGKVFTNKKACNVTPLKINQHNRKKNYLLKEGNVIRPLIQMGIFTKEGKVVHAMYDKYKQINRFIELLHDEIKQFDKTKPLNIIDFGCGKSYLTFLIYYYLTEIMQLAVNIIGLDLKQDVVKHCNETAKEYGYEHLTFEVGDINGYEVEHDVDVVITLHACDTATDYALYSAIKWNASLIFSVPCCQHELNKQMSSDNFSIVTRYGIVKERMAALMTDAIRGNMLEYSGYKTQLLEFVELDHTPKNIMIRAKKTNRNEKIKQKAMDEVENLMNEFSLKPTLYTLLMDDKE